MGLSYSEIYTSILLYCKKAKHPVEGFLSTFLKFTVSAPI